MFVTCISRQEHHAYWLLPTRKIYTLAHHMLEDSASSRSGPCNAMGCSCAHSGRLAQLLLWCLHAHLVMNGKVGTRKLSNDPRQAAQARGRKDAPQHAEPAPRWPARQPRHIADSLPSPLSLARRLSHHVMHACRVRPGGAPRRQSLVPAQAQRTPGCTANAAKALCMLRGDSLQAGARDSSGEHW